VRTASMMIAWALLGCPHLHAEPNAKERITVCGTLKQQDGTPASKAMVELHGRATDTVDDPVANRYELSRTDGDGHFVFRSSYVDRQYWLSISGVRGCEGLSLHDRESKRLPVKFQRSGGQGECDSEINLVADEHCDLTLR
jgi:hypothetical protein